MTGSSDIYVSYAAPDRAWAEMLARALRVEGWSVYWDFDLPSEEQHEEALETAKLTLVVWSDLASRSPLIERSVQWILENDAGFIVQRDRSELPLGLGRRTRTMNLQAWEGGSLPGYLLYHLRMRLSLSRVEFPRLREPPPDLRDHVEMSAREESPYTPAYTPAEPAAVPTLAYPASPPPPPARQARRLLMMTMACVALLSAGLGGAWYYQTITAHAVPSQGEVAAPASRIRSG